MKRVAFLAVAFVAVAGAVWAGRANYFETTVNAAAHEAYGSLYDTRNSADNVQYIGCALNIVGGTARVICEARNAASVSLVCTSGDPELVKVAQALTDNGYLFFRCDAANNLTYLYVSKSSVWLP